MKLKDKLNGLECNIFQLIKYEIISWFNNLVDRLYPLEPLTNAKKCRKCNKYILKRFASYSIPELAEYKDELCICTKKRKSDIEETLSWIDIESDNDNDSESDQCEDCKNGKT